MWFIEKQTLSIKLLSQTIMSVGKDEEPYLNSQCITIIRCAKLKATAPTPPFWTTLTTEKDTTSSLQPLKITAVHVHQFIWSAGPSCQSVLHISALNDLIQTVCVCSRFTQKLVELEDSRGTCFLLIRQEKMPIIGPLVLFDPPSYALNWLVSNTSRWAALSQPRVMNPSLLLFLNNLQLFG